MTMQAAAPIDLVAAGLPIAAPASDESSAGLLDVAHGEWRVCRIDPDTHVRLSSAVPVRRGKAGVTARALAAIMTRRYRDARLLDEIGVEIEEATGHHIPRGGLAKWIIEAGPWIESVALALREIGLRAPLLHAANVSVGTHDSGTRRLWLYLSGACHEVNPPIAWFRFSPDRVGGCAKRDLAGYAGTLQCEPGAGYDNLLRFGTVTHAGGWALVETRLRSFTARDQPPIIARAHATIDALRAVEDRAGSDLARRTALRALESAPLLAALRKELAAAIDSIGDRNTRLRETVAHMLAHWGRLARFADDPGIDFESVTAQEILGRLALQRGWLLGHRPQLVAAIQTVLETCRLNGIDPEQYLATVLAAQVTGGDYEPPLPPAWRKRAIATS